MKKLIFILLFACLFSCKKEEIYKEIYEGVHCWECTEYVKTTIVDFELKSNVKTYMICLTEREKNEYVKHMKTVNYHKNKSFNDIVIDEYFINCKNK